MKRAFYWGPLSTHKYHSRCCIFKTSVGGVPSLEATHEIHIFMQHLKQGYASSKTITAQYCSGWRRIWHFWENNVTQR